MNASDVLKPIEVYSSSAKSEIEEFQKQVNDLFIYSQQLEKVDISHHVNEIEQIGLLTIYY